MNLYQALSTSTSSTSTSSTSTSTSTSASATPTSWTSYGCVAEGTTGSRRALTGASFSQANMTPQVCQGLCSGFKYAGVEYRQASFVILRGRRSLTSLCFSNVTPFSTQCMCNNSIYTECQMLILLSLGYCGDSLTGNGATGAVISSSNCQNKCGGDPNQLCGGSWTMNVYSQGSSSTWTNAGCYVDAATRMLRGSSNTLSGLTTEKCIDLCSTGGYTMAATEYGRECYCGSQFYKEGGAGVVASPSTCNVACEGNSTQNSSISFSETIFLGNPSQICGGGWRGSLYIKPGTSLP